MLSRNKFPKGFINLKIKWHYLHRSLLSIFLARSCRLSKKASEALSVAGDDSLSCTQEEEEEAERINGKIYGQVQSGSSSGKRVTNKRDTDELELNLIFGRYWRVDLLEKFRRALFHFVCWLYKKCTSVWKCITYQETKEHVLK